MIPSKPNMTAQEARPILLALAGGSAIQKRAAMLHCEREGIPVSEMRDLARRVSESPRSEPAK